MPCRVCQTGLFTEEVKRGLCSHCLAETLPARWWANYLRDQAEAFWRQWKGKR